MLHLDYRDPRPIYEQIRQEFMRLILSGAIAPGEKLPSVRDLAGTLSINPNTIQRAYRELEATGYLYRCPRQGFVCRSSQAPCRRRKKQELLAQIRSLAREAIVLGATRDELLAQLDAKEEEA